MNTLRARADDPAGRKHLYRPTAHSPTTTNGADGAHHQLHGRGAVDTRANPDSTSPAGPSAPPASLHADRTLGRRQRSRPAFVRQTSTGDVGRVTLRVWLTVPAPFGLLPHRTWNMARAAGWIAGDSERANELLWRALLRDELALDLASLRVWVNRRLLGRLLSRQAGRSGRHRPLDHLDDLGRRRTVRLKLAR